MDTNEIEAQLRQFTASENFHSHLGFSYTDGVKFLADEAGAYWLLDAIAARQKKARHDPVLRKFQIWKLTVANKRGVLACLRRPEDEVFREEIPFTGFPLAEITLHLTDRLLHLPSEA